MKTLLSSFKLTIVFCVLLFVGYVLVLWGFAAVVKPNHGKAELVILNKKTVGAANIGQKFTQAKYFLGRPSTVDYDGSHSGGSNKGTSNKEYLQEVNMRITEFLATHPYLNKKDIPSELVTSSGSGLDPDISPLAANIQIRRIAEVRGLPENVIKKIVFEHTKRPLLGQPHIDVLELNIALDNETNYTPQKNE